MVERPFVAISASSPVVDVSGIGSDPLQPTSRGEVEATEAMDRAIASRDIGVSPERSTNLARKYRKDSNDHDLRWLPFAVVRPLKTLP
jgi:hypothetical protein